MLLQVNDGQIGQCEAKKCGTYYSIARLAEKGGPGGRLNWVGT
jgi:hypothetical protein